MTIADFEKKKCETLLKYGANDRFLWLTECTTVKDFQSYWGRSLVEDLGIQDKKYIVYWHESGSVMQSAAFDNEPEFEDACKIVAGSITGDY